ncbi:MAG TPA: DUF6495 family protein [Membranihabitans sp.]|nr:DUF6495 family protein [Membranihabitans sp.]
MMKYRILTREELEELESEFVTFLAANGIPAEDWVKIKEKEVEKSQKLIEVFSDVVFEKILSTVHFLEHRQQDTIRIFRFDEEKITMNGIHIEGKSAIDFTKNQDTNTLVQLYNLNPGKLKIFTAEKRYKEDKLQEIFKLMQSGAQILKNDRLFQTIEQLKTSHP